MRKQEIMRIGGTVAKIIGAASLALSFRELNQQIKQARWLQEVMKEDHRDLVRSVIEAHDLLLGVRDAPTGPTGPTGQARFDLFDARRKARLARGWEPRRGEDAPHGD
jgi:hypothetical protein